MFETNTARSADSGSDMEFTKDRISFAPTEKLPLVLCVLALSALAGGSTAWVVVKVISLLGT